MSQANPFDQFDGHAAASPGVLVGPPPKPADAPTPYQIEDQTMQRNRDARETAQWQASHNPDGSEKPKVITDGKPSEFQAKAASFYGRMLEAEQQYNAVPAANRDARMLPGQVLHDTMPGLENSLPVWMGGNDADRQKSDQAALNFVRATLRQESGASINADEEVKQFKIFYPMPGDSQEVIDQKAIARKQAMEGFRIASGPLAKDIEATVMPQPAEKKDDNGNPIAVAGATDGGGSDGTDGGGDQVLTGTVSYDPTEWDAQGNFIGDPSSPNSPDMGDPRRAARKAELESIIKGRGVDTSTAGNAAYDHVVQGATLGLSDELSGLGGAVGALFQNKPVLDAYRNSRDATRLQLSQESTASPYASGLSEFAGGMLVPVKGGAGATGLADLAKTGAKVGGVAGFGYGNGAQGSLINAAAGGVTGAVAAPLIAKTGAALAASRPGQAVINRFTGGGVVGNGLSAKAADLEAAGAAEGINIPRVLVDPKLENKMTGTDASMFGGPRVQAGMRKIEGQIEDGVNAKGAGGTAYADKNAEGDAYRTAGERFIKQSGKQANAEYDNAVNLAGDTKVPAKESLGVVDEMLGKLSETPNSNKAEIAYLEGLKGDLSKDLSVGALRDLRTTLRKKVSGGDLVFGQNEARVLDIMDAAGNDIRAGLAAAGKTDAAQAFDVADKNYRDRMEYITGTLQKVIGKRNSNLSSEGVADKLVSMARGKDAEGLRKFYSHLTPDEAADTAATFADRIGRNGKEGFSVSHFVTQTAPKNGYTPRVLETLFGKDGAESIANLRKIAVETERVTKTMNSRKSGTGVANDWRSLLGNIVLGGGGMGFAGGNVGSAIAGAAATGGAKAARDIFSARSLLSPDLTKWILRAPRTTDAAAITRHMSQLDQLAAKFPALVMDRNRLADYVRSAIAESPTRAAASDQKGDTRSPPPAQ